MKKLNHVGLRRHATIKEKNFVGPAAPTKRREYCKVCGAAKPEKGGCVLCSRATKARYKARHVVKIKVDRATYRKTKHVAGATVRATKKAERRATLRARRAKAKRAWKVRNRGAVNASTAGRFAAKMHATPPWANKFFIKEAYHLAALRSDMMGFKWEVDHILPLRHKLFCGLHVEYNLRVIPRADNMKKGNRAPPELLGAAIVVEQLSEKK